MSVFQERAVHIVCIPRKSDIQIEKVNQIVMGHLNMSTNKQELYSSHSKYWFTVAYKDISSLFRNLIYKKTQHLQDKRSVFSISIISA